MERRTGNVQPKNKSRLKKDIAQLREIFCETDSTDVFRPKCISDGEFEREKMIKKYSKYRSERYERIRLKQLDEDVLKDKDKKILKDDSKSYVKLRSRLRECSGDDDMEAFSRSEDMILNACRNCGCNPFSYDPLRSKQMTEEEVLVKQQIVESGIKPIYSYSEYLLCPVVPFDDSRIMDDKYFRFIERTNVRKSALHTACHFGEWEVVSVLTNAILGDSIVTPSQRKKIPLILSSRTRHAEILRLCLEHVKYMEEMTPELASFTAPTPDHKPAQSNDPSDLKVNVVSRNRKRKEQKAGINRGNVYCITEYRKKERKGKNPVRRRR